MDINELARQERLNYYRKWRADHKEQVKQHQSNYWRRKAEKHLKENG